MHYYVYIVWYAWSRVKANNKEFERALFDNYKDAKEFATLIAFRTGLPMCVDIEELRMRETEA